MPLLSRTPVSWLRELAADLLRVSAAAPNSEYCQGLDDARKQFGFTTILNEGEKL